MNKSDLKLLVYLTMILLSLLLLLKLNSKKGSTAKVYYENKEILKVDLIINKEYIVNGYNGDVKIIVKDNKIKVESENSPLNLCSKQGYIESSNEVIVCLPNKIVIKIEDSEKIDGVVG